MSQFAKEVLLTLAHDADHNFQKAFGNMLKI